MDHYQAVKQAVTEQISDQDYYEGGEMEHALKHIEALQETVGALAAAMACFNNWDMEHLQQVLPSYGKSTIVERYNELMKRGF